jgi:hypothetical protein
MSWYESVLPSHTEVEHDLTSRDINYHRWKELANREEVLLRELCQCYAKHNYGHRRFDEQLHRTGVRLRLDAYCAHLLNEYPQLQNK